MGDFWPPLHGVSAVEEEKEEEEEEDFWSFSSSPFFFLQCPIGNRTYEEVGLVPNLLWCCGPRE